MISLKNDDVDSLNSKMIPFLYNYRLLMRSTHDHEDRVRYWLTDAVDGGQPIPVKVTIPDKITENNIVYLIYKKYRI